jgi:hypothetical protein
MEGPNLVIGYIFVFNSMSVFSDLKIYYICHTEKSCHFSVIRGCIQKFPDWVYNKYTLTTINTCWEAIQRLMAAKLTRLTQWIAIQLQLVAESFTIFSSLFRRPVRKLLDTPPYTPVSIEFVIKVLEISFHVSSSLISSLSLYKIKLIIIIIIIIIYWEIIRFNWLKIGNKWPVSVNKVTNPRI